MLADDSVSPIPSSGVSRIPLQASSRNSPLSSEGLSLKLASLKLATASSAIPRHELQRQSITKQSQNIPWQNRARDNYIRNDFYDILYRYLALKKAYDKRLVVPTNLNSKQKKLWFKESEIELNEAKLSLIKVMKKYQVWKEGPRGIGREGDLLREIDLVKEIDLSWVSLPEVVMKNLRDLFPSCDMAKVGHGTAFWDCDTVKVSRGTAFGEAGQDTPLVYPGTICHPGTVWVSEAHSPNEENRRCALMLDILSMWKKCRQYDKEIFDLSKLSILLNDVLFIYEVLPHAIAGSRPPSFHTLLLPFEVSVEFDASNKSPEDAILLWQGKPLCKLGQGMPGQGISFAYFGEGWGKEVNSSVEKIRQWQLVLSTHLRWQTFYQYQQKTFNLSELLIRESDVPFMRRFLEVTNDFLPSTCHQVLFPKVHVNFVNNPSNHAPKNRLLALEQPPFERRLESTPQVGYRHEGNEGGRFKKAFENRLAQPIASVDKVNMRSAALKPEILSGRERGAQVDTSYYSPDKVLERETTLRKGLATKNKPNANVMPPTRVYTNSPLRRRAVDVIGELDKKNEVQKKEDKEFLEFLDLLNIIEYPVSELMKNWEVKKGEYNNNLLKYLRSEWCLVRKVSPGQPESSDDRLNKNWVIQKHEYNEFLDFLEYINMVGYPTILELMKNWEVKKEKHNNNLLSYLYSELSLFRNVSSERPETSGDRLKRWRLQAEPVNAILPSDEPEQVKYVSSESLHKLYDEIDNFSRCS